MKQSMNFEHIQTKWPQLHQLAAFAEEYVISDPQSAFIKGLLISLMEIMHHIYLTL